MIAYHPDNPNDQWLIEAEFFATSYEPADGA
jgi:hypothetical protein